MNVDQEFALFVRRSGQFLNIWTIYTDLLSGRYQPSVQIQNPALEDVEKDDPASIAYMVPTVMFVLYSFFYSLIEDSEDGLDAFRIWRAKYSEEETAIAAMEQKVASIRPDLRVFRNRLGFHGSRSLEYELKGFDLFANHSGTNMIQVMQVFKALSCAIIMKNLALQHSSAEEMTVARAWIDSIPGRCDAI